MWHPRRLCYPKDLAGDAASASAVTIVIRLWTLSWGARWVATTGGLGIGDARAASLERKPGLAENAKHPRLLLLPVRSSTDFGGMEGGEVPWAGARCSAD